MKNTLSKNERLSSKKTIQELFSKSSSFYLHPFLVKHKLVEEQTKHAVLISVSKRKFKNASDRNLIKRRTKEAYRLNKHIISTLLNEMKPLNIGLVYGAKEELSFDFIEKKLILILKRLVNELSEQRE